MKKLLFRFGTTIACISTCFALSASTHTHNNLYPNLELSFTPQIGDHVALSVKGEFGDRNLRGDGTVGCWITPCQRLKVSGEFLAQRLKYHFFKDLPKRWVHQYSIGGEYQYIFNVPVLQSVEIGSLYAHAFKRHLKTRTFVSNNVQTTVERRIAGSDGVLSFLGLTIEPWSCGFLSGAVEYDHVKYHRHLSSKKQASGFGGSVSFTQWIYEGLSLDLDAEFRRPFDFYKAALNWKQVFSWWVGNFGIYASYEQGKKHLPNVVAGGVHIDFDFLSKRTKCCRNEKTKNCEINQYCDLTNWVAQSAAFVPVVLAIADPRVTTVTPICVLPTSRPIPDQEISPNTPPDPFYTFDVSPFFSSPTPLTFSATGLPAGNTINPTTGVISGNSPEDSFPPGVIVPYTITVTARNVCGQTSRTFTATYPSPPD